ncbi:MAG: hypothetical protein ACK41D_00185 [Rubricoccaceae bacterium]
MLSTALFAAAGDPEAARYRILAGLQEARHAFARSRVYPHLAGLVALRRDLEAFLDGLGRHRGAQPGRVAGVDWEAGTLRYAPDEAAPPLLAEDLAAWALPLLADAIEEGRTLFEFVDQHAALAAVGLVPAYRAEGFLLVPDEQGSVCALRYRVSALTGHDGAYRSLRTAPVEADLPPLAPPDLWKRALVEACPDLPAPATFVVESDVPFPLDETMLPVAKRKLLALVAPRGEA